MTLDITTLTPRDDRTVDLFMKSYHYHRAQRQTQSEAIWNARRFIFEVRRDDVERTYELLDLIHPTMLP